MEMEMYLCTNWMVMELDLDVDGWQQDCDNSNFEGNEWSAQSFELWKTSIENTTADRDNANVFDFEESMMSLTTDIDIEIVITPED